MKSGPRLSAATKPDCTSHDERGTGPGCQNLPIRLAEFPRKSSRHRRGHQA